MKTKRILAMLTAIALIGSLSACSGSKDSSTDESAQSSAADTTVQTDDTETSDSGSDSSEIEMETKDLGKDIMLNIDGFDVSVDEYKYYFAYAKSTIDNGDASYWDNDESGEKIEQLKQQALTYLFQSYTIYVLAKNNNVEMTDEDQKKIDDQYAKNKMYYELSNSGSTFEDFLAQKSCTKEVYRESIVREALERKVVSALYEADFRENYFKSFCHFKMIVLNPQIHYQVDENNNRTENALDFYTLNPDLTYTDEEKAIIEKLNGLAKNKDKDGINAALPELAGVIRQRLDAGEAFDNLVKKYSTDDSTPLNEDGTYQGYYLPAETIGQSYNSELADALNSIDVNQYSDAVQSNKIYYIVQKLPNDEAYLKDNIVNFFMGSEQYPYSNKYSQMYKSLQTSMKVQCSPDYTNLTADFAGNAGNITEGSVTEEQTTQADQTSAETAVETAAVSTAQ